MKWGNDLNIKKQVGIKATTVVQCLDHNLVISKNLFSAVSVKYFDGLVTLTDKSNVLLITSSLVIF